MSKNLIARVKHNLQAYEAAKDAWIADKKNDADIHDNYVNARDTLEMGAYDDESELLAVVASLQAENARLREFVSRVAEGWQDSVGGEEHNMLLNLSLQAAALADVEAVSTAGGEQ